jgi:hypothetical protein
LIVDRDFYRLGCDLGHILFGDVEIW